MVYRDTYLAAYPTTKPLIGDDMIGQMFRVLEYNFV